MDTLLLVTLLLLSVFSIWLLITNQRIKRLHSHKMQQLKTVFKNLSKKQAQLSEKTLITNDFQLHYKSEMKKLSEEIFDLQKRIFALLSKQ